MLSRINQLKIALAFLSLVVLLSACSDGKSLINEGLEVGDSGGTDASWIIDTYAVAIEDEGKLVLVDTTGVNIAKVYTFKSNELPPGRSFDTFHISYSKRYVVWYSPVLGMLAYDIEENSVIKIYKPTDWFNEYPFIYMSINEDMVMFIDNQGETIINISLVDKEVNEISIPYPFGTRFIPSPDLSLILYISGYAQDVTRPTYLITEWNGENSRQFATDGSVPNRAIVVWHPSNKGILTVGENDGEIWQYLLEKLESPKLFYKFEEGVQIRQLKNVENNIFVYTSDGSWIVVDSDGNLVSSTPTSAYQELNKPVFYPINDDLMLIEETIIAGDVKINRLWRSNWIGIKEVLYPSYHQTEIVTEPFEL